MTQSLSTMLHVELEVLRKHANFADCFSKMVGDTRALGSLIFWEQLRRPPSRGFEILIDTGHAISMTVPPMGPSRKDPFCLKTINKGSSCSGVFWV